MAVKYKVGDLKEILKGLKDSDTICPLCHPELPSAGTCRCDWEHGMIRGDKNE